MWHLFSSVNSPKFFLYVWDTLFFVHFKKGKQGGLLLFIYCPLPPKHTMTTDQMCVKNVQLYIWIYIFYNLYGGALPQNYFSIFKCPWLLLLLPSFFLRPPKVGKAVICAPGRGAVGSWWGSVVLLATTASSGCNVGRLHRPPPPPTHSTLHHPPPRHFCISSVTGQI